MYCDGKPVIVPASSLSVIYSQTPGYIDPLDPGSCTKPNIAATRGIHEPGLAGGLLTTPRVDVDLTTEYRPPVGKGVLAQSVFGLQILNLFDQLYNVPVYNGCYGSPISTGLQSGNAPCTYSVGALRTARRRGALVGAYFTYPNLPPISFRLYYQVTI